MLLWTQIVLLMSYRSDMEYVGLILGLDLLMATSRVQFYLIKIFKNV